MSSSPWQSCFLSHRAMSATTFSSFDEFQRWRSLSMRVLVAVWSLGTADSLGQTKLTNWIWEIYGNVKNCKNNWKNWTKLGKKGEKKIRPEGFWVFAQSRGICEFSVPILGLNRVKRLSRGVASRVSAARHQGGTAKTSGHNGSWDVSGKRESLSSDAHAIIFKISSNSTKTTGTCHLNMSGGKNTTNILILIIINNNKKKTSRTTRCQEQKAELSYGTSQAPVTISSFVVRPLRCNSTGHSLQEVRLETCGG